MGVDRSHRHPAAIGVIILLAGLLFACEQPPPPDTVTEQLELAEDMPATITMEADAPRQEPDVAAGDPSETNDGPRVASQNSKWRKDLASDKALRRDPSVDRLTNSPDANANTTTPPPPRPAPPVDTDPIEECTPLARPVRQSTCNRLRGLPLARPEVDLPDTMKEGRPDTVSFRLERTGSSEVLEADADPRIQAQRRDLGAPVPIGARMSARLIGTQFEIVPEDDQVRDINGADAVSWQWRVTPEQHGEQKLYIKTSLLLEDDAQTIEKLYEYQPLTVRVDVDHGRAFDRTADDLWSLYGLGLAILALLTLAIVIWRRVRSKEEPPLPPMP